MKVGAHHRKWAHLVMAVVFLVLLVLVCFPGMPLVDLQKSLPFLVAISLYANFVGHLSGASAETPSED